MRAPSILTARRVPLRGFCSSLIAVSCMLVVGQAIVIATLGHRTLGPLVSDVIQLALGLICILACTEAFRRSRGIARYAWRLLAVAFVVWAVAQVLAVYVDASGDHSPDNLADILFFVSVVPFGMLSFLDPDSEPNSFDRLHILDFVQVGILLTSIFLCFSPGMWSPGDAFRLGHFTWTRNIAFDGLLVVTLVLRSFLTKSKAVRWLFGRMALFLLLSGLADSFALSPGRDLRPGGWFDLIWSGLLGLPILIAATWKNAKEDQTDGSPKSQSIFINQVFPVAYPLISFFVLARVNRAYPIQSTILFALAFMTFAVRVLVIQHRQGQSKEAERQSEIGYRLLFDSNPLPMWVFERKTLKFLAVNEAAARQYGFSRRDFLTMTIADIRPAEEVPALSEAIAKPLHGLQGAGTWRHRKKDGAIFDVEIIAHDLDFHGIEAALITARDVTDYKKAGETAQRLASIVEFSQDAIIGKNKDGVITSWNRAAEKMYGYTTAEAVGRHLSFLVPAEKQAETRILMERIGKGEPIECLETQRLRKGGSVLEVSLSISPIRDGGGNVTGASAIARDITFRKQAEEALLFKTALLEAQAEATIDGILVVDESDHILLTNKQFGRHFEIPDALLSTRDDQTVLNHVLTRIESPDVFTERVKYLYSHREENSRDEFRLTNGKVFDRYSAPLVDLEGRYRGRIWYFRDITDHKLSEERAQYLAHYDALTGLPNRTLLRDRLAKALADAHRQKEKVALLFLDLDKFKDINDSLGHEVGDRLLQEVAARLKKWGREQDTIARLGGDEFLISLTHVKDVPDVAVAAERLMNGMTCEFVIQGHSLSIGCCIGISIFPEHGADSETLIKNADAAMHSAKANGRHNFRFFTEDVNEQAVERLTLESNLRSALAKGQLFLMYQPQIDIASGKMIGLEALLRWQHPGLGLVPPDKFIPIAENSGLIVPIGEWVLRTACSQARKWQNEGLPLVTVAVNVSAVQFRQDGFCQLIRSVLHETGLAAQYLELELTESLLLANADVTLSVLRELKSMGLTLAIDDFGTGYSNFTSLRQFRVSKLKIDRSFIADVAIKPDDAAITAAIISMAKSLNLKVIAEGVEDEAQMSFLRAHHCDQIQGYYFSKPLPVDKVADKLRDNLAEIEAGRELAADNRNNKPSEVSISLMSIGLALLVSADPATIQQFSLALRELSISADACQDAASAALLLKRRKFDAIIVDLQLGEQPEHILDEARLSPSNRTAVTFGIDDNNAEVTSAFRKKSQFVFERPLSPQSIHKTLKPAYGLILRERRRYFRHPVSIPVIIQCESGQEILGNSVNISAGGMALSMQVPLVPEERVRVQLTLPDHQAPLLAESTICWSKTGQLGVRFVSMSDEHKSELQVWLSQKLEETLPEFVADQFRKAELC
jgi:diguanylate cyclase (GGDEF)-like protein/PAS domain S-box-containing protein